MGRMFRCVGLGSRVGLGGTESSGWQGWEHSLEAGLSPACQLEPQELLAQLRHVTTSSFQSNQERCIWRNRKGVVRCMGDLACLS